MPVGLILQGSLNVFVVSQDHLSLRSVIRSIGHILCGRAPKSEPSFVVGHLGAIVVVWILCGSLGAGGGFAHQFTSITYPTCDKLLQFHNTCLTSSGTTGGKPNRANNGLGGAHVRIDSRSTGQRAGNAYGTRTRRPGTSPFLRREIASLAFSRGRASTCQSSLPARA